MKLLATQSWVWTGEGLGRTTRTPNGAGPVGAGPAFGPGPDPSPWRGLVLGVGLGGFFDGIVLHQILQWHHMLSSHPDPAVAGDLPLNTLWDGPFHAVTYLFTVVGVVLIWRAWRRPDVPASGWTLLGAALAGWGVFNLVEGTVDRHLLGIHHVWPDGPGSVLLWDLAFLGWGSAMVVARYAIARRDARA